MVMQRALLAEVTPVLPGVDIAASYVLASEDSAAGGDWFDAAPVDDTRVMLVTGDVVGHGTQAAAVMGQLRAVLRQQLLAGADLGVALRSLDAFVPHVPGARAATVCAALLDTASGDLAYCTAGHPPPLVVSDAGAEFLPPSGAGPLGTGSDLAVATAQLRVGDSLLLYTDGLIDRPGRSAPASTAELAAVAAGVAAARGFPIETGPRPVVQLCTRVLELLTRRTGHADDITLLVAQRCPRGDNLDIDLVCPDARVESTLRAELRRWLVALGVENDDIVKITHVATEFIDNAAEHAYPTGQSAPVALSGRLTARGAIELVVTDQGRWKAPSPDDERGFGLSMAAAMVDDTRIESGAAGTIARASHRVGRPAVLLGEIDLIRPARAPVAQCRIDSPAPQQLRVSGEVDAEAAVGLADALTAESYAGTADLTVDLGEVTLLSSRAVVALLAADERFRDQGRSLNLVASPGSVAHHVGSLVGLKISMPHRDGDFGGH